MSWLDDVRRKKQELDAKRASAPPTAQKPIKEKPKREKPPPEPTPATLTYSCGHKEGTKALEGRKCPACQGKGRKAAKGRQKARVREKVEKGGGEVFHKVGFQGKHVPRLPDGARFCLIYDSEQLMWRGTLSIPMTINDLPGAKVFEDSSPGVNKLPWKLDKQYREWLRQQEKPVNEKKEEEGEKSEN